MMDENVVCCGRKKSKRERRVGMSLMRGEPLVSKLATLAKFVVLPGAMVAAMIYSPQQDPNKKSDSK